MYEVADGARIQMWQALPTTDRLVVSDIVSYEFFLGRRRNVFQARGEDAIKPFSNGGLRNNYRTLAGFAFSYLIITVVPWRFLIRVLTLGRCTHH